MYKWTFVLFLMSSFLSSTQIEAKKRQQETVIVFAPHPDDDILGCGGTLIHHVRNGDHVIIVYMTSGGAAEWKGKRKDLEEIREQEARNAAAKIGVEDLIFLREPDGALEQSLENVTNVVRIILDYKPTTAYIPHSADDHEDHQATHWLVVAAAKKASGAKKHAWKVPRILCYEVWTPLFEVTDKEEISDVIDLKLEALAEHKTQLVHLNFIEAIKGLNCYRGLMTLTGKYAECFALLKNR